MSGAGIAPQTPAINQPNKPNPGDSWPAGTGFEWRPPGPPFRTRLARFQRRRSSYDAAFRDKNEPDPTVLSQLTVDIGISYQNRAGEVQIPFAAGLQHQPGV